MKNYTLFWILLLSIAITSCFSLGYNHDNTHGTIVSGEQEVYIRELFRSENIMGIAKSLRYYSNEMPIETQLDSAFDTVVIVDTTKNYVNVHFFGYQDTSACLIDLHSPLKTLNEGVLTDYFDNSGIVGWVTQPEVFGEGSEPNERNTYKLHLTLIDLESKREIFHDIILLTRCCIDRLSMKYNPFTHSVLFAYNDFSKSDSEYLMYGSVCLDSFQEGNIELHPDQILLEDKWEKSFPEFLINDDSVYLYHSSGDRWGAFAYSGKHEIGISAIDQQNQPVNYRLVIDSLPINEKVLLLGDTLFYRIANSNVYDEMVIKKVALRDLEKFRQ